MTALQSDLSYLTEKADQLLEDLLKNPVQADHYNSEMVEAIVESEIPKYMQQTLIDIFQRPIEDEDAYDHLQKAIWCLM